MPKISDLPTVPVAAQLDDLMPLVQEDETRRVTVRQIGAAIGSLEGDASISRSEPVNLASDHTFTLGVIRVFVGVGGTVVGRLSDDTEDRTYYNVPSGEYLRGAFTIIRSTANGTTASGLIGEAP